MNPLKKFASILPFKKNESTPEKYEMNLTSYYFGKFKQEGETHEPSTTTYLLKDLNDDQLHAPIDPKSVFIHTDKETGVKSLAYVDREAISEFGMYNAMIFDGQYFRPTQVHRATPTNDPRDTAIFVERIDTTINTLDVIRDKHLIFEQDDVRLPEHLHFVAQAINCFPFSEYERQAKEYADSLPSETSADERKLAQNTYQRPLEKLGIENNLQITISDLIPFAVHVRNIYQINDKHERKLLQADIERKEHAKTIFKDFPVAEKN